MISSLKPALYSVSIFDNPRGYMFRSIEAYVSDVLGGDHII